MVRVELSSSLALNVQNLIQNSPKLKKKIQSQVQMAIQEGRIKGSQQYSLEQMKGIARYEFLYMLEENMPETLRNSLNRGHYGNPALFGDGIKITDPKTETQADGTTKYVISIEFNENALFRKSLYEKGYPQGEPDIFASFNFGFTVKSEKRAYGYWQSSKKRVPGLRHRSGLHFLEKTVNDFNSRYRSQGCYAVMGEQYS